MKENVFVSTSGGRSSALLAYLYWLRFKDKYNIVFGFANTSREREETLVFVDNLTRYFGIEIVWVEAVINHGGRGRGYGTTHKVVTFKTACRDGSVFEDMIVKYGIPNKSFPHCTRELKTNPLRSYLKSIGWGAFTQYTTIIGYRADEPLRASVEKAFKLHQSYPLWEWGIKKADVAAFWLKQEFDLGLIDSEGNCDKCYKKSDGKVLYQYYSQPKDEWVPMIERKYGDHSAGREGVAGPYRFFRDGRTLEEIVDQYPDFDPQSVIDNDKSLNQNNSEYDFDLNEQEECSGSCEPFGMDEIEFSDEEITPKAN